MAVFRSMKIVHKLSAMAGLLVVGFGGIGATYLHLRSLRTEVDSRAVALQNFGTAAARVGVSALGSQIVLKDFFLSRDATLVEQFTGTLTTAANDTDTLAQLAQNEQQQQLITELKETLSIYQKTAGLAVDLVTSLGLGDDDGLRGAVQSQARALEETLTKTQEQEGTAPASLEQLVQTMRRHEKDFLIQDKSSYVQRFAEARRAFDAAVQASTYPETEKAQLAQLTEAYHAAFRQVAAATKKRDPLFVQLVQHQSAMETLVGSLEKVTEQALKENTEAGLLRIQRIQTLFAALLGAAAVLTIVALGTVALGITRSLRRLQSTLQQVTAGDTQVRTGMGQGDELATLGQAFDAMLDERAAYEQERATRLEETQRENDALNDSIVTLIEAVGQLSQKDLTVKVPVAENVTGAVADSLNLLAEETSQVLAEVTRIAESVASASRSVKRQSDTVMTLADAEREQVTDTAEQLVAAAQAMNDIAALAQTCNMAAEQAITKTQTALETVTNTVEGINTIRDTIRETEKRIKRLGERSQEISGAVNLINGIAERTHILALNASMHAASAGEAGRGFAVVADEVQRLAENARQSTEQIAHLVSNIQTETMDTVTTMNTVISQVVEGSRLAGQAGEQMRQTQQSTAELVASVRQIAAGAQSQAEVSNILRDRADIIVESTRKTSEQLTAQGGQTTRLLDDASRLVRAVRVFKLSQQHVEAHTAESDELLPAEEPTGEENVREELIQV